MKILKQNAAIYFEENPTATFDDFKVHFGDFDYLTPELLDIAFVNAPTENLTLISRRKRIFQLITVVSVLAVLICITYFTKSYIDFLDATPVSVETNLPMVKLFCIEKIQ